MRTTIGTTALVLLVGCSRQPVSLVDEGAADRTRDAAGAPEAAAVTAGSGPADCDAWRAGQGVRCEKACLAEHKCITAEVTNPDGSEERRCVECLVDAHCRANPHARGPRCNEKYKVCECRADEDCNSCFPGLECLGGAFVGVCGCDELGPSGDCPAGTVCHGLDCKPPCRPEDCEPKRKCDQRPTSPTYGVCVWCLTDAGCDQASARPNCVPAWGHCGCNEDSSCSKNPAGRKCLKVCIHHPGVASCSSSCGCTGDGDCPAGTTCDKDQHPYRCEAP